MAITKAGTDVWDWGEDVVSAGNVTVSHTLVAGSDRKVVVRIAEFADEDDFTISSVTYGGNAMTEAIREEFTSSGILVATSVWYIDEGDLPANGARDCVVTYDSHTGEFNESGVSVAQYDGIKSGVPEDTDGNQDITDTTNVLANSVGAVAASEWAFSCWYSFDEVSTLTWNNSQTEIEDRGMFDGRHGVADLEGGSGETSLNTTTTLNPSGMLFRVVAVWDQAAAAGGRNRIIMTG